MLKRLFSLFLVFAATLAVAQQRPGSLRGTITDAKTGEPIPFANVSVKDDAGSIVTGGSTDFDGKYNINPVQAGSYLVEVSFAGYATIKVSGVLVSPNSPTIQNFKMREESEVLGEVTITYEAPLIDKTKNSKVTTAEDIQNMAVRDVTSVASQAAGVTQDANGNTNVRGARGEATVYFIDGIKVRGSVSIPQAAIAQTEVITGGLPAQYGDAIGGVINTTTRGPSGEWFGNTEILTSLPFKYINNSDGAPLLDGQNYNLGAFTIGGPLLKKKGKSIVGFLFSSEFSYIEEPRPVPNGIPYLSLNDGLLEDLEQNPISIANQGRAINFNSEFITNDDLNPIYRRPNSHSNNISLSGNIQIKSSRNTLVTLGGRYVYNNDPNASYLNHIFNYQNNNQTILNDWQAYARFQQTFDNDTSSNSLIKNAYYNIQVDYSRRSQRTFDPEFGEDFFKYGYTGKYDVKQIPAYAPGLDTTLGYSGARFVGFADTGLVYTPADFNQVRTNYISQFLDLADDNPDLADNNVFDLLGFGLPVNGANPRSVYGLWGNVGTQQGFNSNGVGAEYAKSRLSQFRVTASSNFDIGDHSLIVGFEYEQRVDRAFSLDAQGIWTRMRLLQNQPNEQLDLENPLPVFDEDGNYQDTINYNYNYDENASSQFSESVRAQLGLDPLGVDRINIDNLDPSFFSLDMFSADEVINPNGDRGVSYYGFDYTGNIVDNQPSIEEFFTATDENGRLTRPVGAFRPLYIAGYVQDQFTYRDLTFNVGVRVDRFDLNQSVLRDPYILPPFYTVGDLPNTILAESVSNIPAGIGQDYAVYVNSFDYGEGLDIVGYRNGDQYFNADGEPIADPGLLSDLAGGGIKPFLVNPPIDDPTTVDVNEAEQSARITGESFVDYDPQVVVMPRIAFNFPITDEAIFIAHYDVLAQRPTTAFSRLDPFDYLDLQNLRNGGLLNNPNLLPQRTTEYEIAFKQVLTQKSALKLAAFYRELRDLLQSIPYPEAYPRTYVAYGNRDFGTVKGFQLEYEMRRTNNLKIDANYTLQFANGTGSSSNTGLNLARAGQPGLRTLLPFDYDNRHQFLVRLDWRYGRGINYNGPVINGKNILENFGVNLVMNALSGRPYTKRDRAYAVTVNNPATAAQTVGQVNGSRLPWQVTFDMRINKTFLLSKNGKNSLDVYFQILNLANTMNVLNVYPFTGSPDDDGFLSSEQGQAQLASQVSQASFIDLYNRRMNNPFNFSLPRRVRLGISYNF
jgi:outer membrane receptor protein involved in Fe transport